MRPIVPMKLLLAAILAIALPSSLAILAQEVSDEPNAPSPATRHAQVIAHGVMALPAAEIGWRVTIARALPPNRAAAEKRFAGFFLAEKGAIALTDAEGVVLTRLAPGEAVWIAPGTTAAVISLEKKAVDYIDIAPRPAAVLGEGGLSLAIGLPFPAPPGEVFDVDLLRDVLERTEESTIPAGLTPSLLIVTRGSLWVTPPGGEAVQLTAGGVAQVEGETVVAGGSRAPAAFVVARIGPALPAQARLQDGMGKATPIAGLPASDSPPEPAGDRLWPEPTPVAETGDSDGDGLSDLDETTLYGTEPRDRDTDDDGLADGEEILASGTNPFLADTDGDGSDDGDEFAASTDPLDAASAPVDALPADAPDQEATDSPLPTPSSAATPAPGGDLDGDGLTTLEEIAGYRTNPTLADSDGDGVGDGEEAAAGTDPRDPESG